MTSDLQKAINELIQANKDLKVMLSEQNIRLSEIKSIGSREYRQGLEDAWKTAGTIAKMDVETETALFKYCYFPYIVDRYSVHEAMEILKDYEVRKKKALLKAGDEIEHDDGTKAIVLETDCDIVKVFTENGCVELYTASELPKWNKTGRHVNLNQVFDWKGEVNADE